MYPLKFYPILKERLWGGTKLGDILGKPLQNTITGESWELSGVEGDVSVVSNGELAGTSLKDLISEDPDGILGRSVGDRFGKEFPILIKFIDAKQDLSIQLHPDDELARIRHNSFGKTEMWYIMDSDEDAQLIVGFKRTVTKEEYLESLKNDRLTDLLNYESVREGDAFLINPGKVHAIGAGTLLAEIQQTSDITYRVFDFNRRDKNGNLRELHTDLALDAIDFEKKDDFMIKYSQKAGSRNLMVDCPYFQTNFLRLSEIFSIDLSGRDSFIIYMCVGGDATIANPEGSASINKGETVLISADTKVVDIQTTGAELLEVTI